MTVKTNSNPGFKKGMKANCTKPPRQREGLDTRRPHNAHAGGKTLRKARQRLLNHIGTGSFGQGDTRPGSMKP